MDDIGERAKMRVLKAHCNPKITQKWAKTRVHPWPEYHFFHEEIGTAVDSQFWGVQSAAPRIDSARRFRL
jgi:hypothetical protein